MKGNCFPFILIILIIFGCIFVKKEDQIREAFGGLKEGFREGQAAGCKTGYNAAPGGQRCYRRYGVQQTWDAAQATCRREGANLATITNAGENAHVARLRGRSTLWIGLNDKAREGTYRWASGNGTNYTNFSGGEPNNAGGREDCIHMWGGNRWNDMPCTSRQSFVCSHPTAAGGGGGGGAGGGGGGGGGAAGGARPTGATCVENDVVRVNGAWRNCCVKCGTGYSATSSIGDGGRCLTCGVARPPPPPRKCSSYGCPCGYINNGEQQCADNKCTQTQCCSRVPKETIPHCISQLSWGRNCAKCDPEGWELSNAPKRVPDKKVPGGGDRYFRPNGVLDPKTWTKCADRNGRCTVKDSRGKYWFRTSQGGGWSSSREWNAQEKTGGIVCNAPSCQKAMEGGAIHDKGKYVGKEKNSGVQPTCGSQTVPSPPPSDCFKQVASDCKKIAQIPIDNCIKQRDWGKSCNSCAVGYKMSSDKTRCDLIPIPFCKNQEREACLECQEAYTIGKTGRTCDRIPKEKIPHCTNQRDWGAYCYECGSDQSGYMTSEDKSKCIPRPISNCKDQEGLRCNRCRFGYSKSLDWTSCDIVAIKDCAIQNKSICTECKMGYKMGEDRRKCDLLPISNCQARYEAFRPGQGFGKDRVFSKAS